MKKIMMILVAVAAIGFTACNKTNTDEQKAQTEQTAEEQKVDGNAAEANEATEQDGEKAEAATTEENTEAKAEEKTDEKKEN